MEITYTYEIHELKETPIVGDFNNVITEVIYTYKGTSDEGISSTYPGRTSLPAPSEGFKPTVELEEQDVISWLDNHAQLNIMQGVIKEEIRKQSGVILRGSSLPWYQPVEETAPDPAFQPNIIEPTPEV